MAKSLLSKDLYAILGVTEDASEKEILKGYRKKALKCHPDKNPDNPKAAEEFHELSQALEILTDAAARAAYNQSLKAKKAVIERNKVLDSKRKKFKEDLEAREQAVFEQGQKQKQSADEEKFAAEIERLRKDGSRLLEQEQERLREELRKQAAETAADNDHQGGETPRVKLKWKAAKGDPENGGYTSDYLRNLLSCYGTVGALVMSGKRNGSAIVEFERSGVSCSILDETGHKDNPMSMLWLSGKPEKTNSGPDEPSIDKNVRMQPGATLFASKSDSHVQQDFEGQRGGDSCGDSDRSFENLVLMRMRQAEERKKLIEQMMKEDADD